MRTPALYVFLFFSSLMLLTGKSSSATGATDEDTEAKKPPKWTHTRGRYDALKCTPMPKNCAFVKRKPHQQPGIEIWQDPDSHVWYQHVDVLNLPVGY
ncbi:MAG: hypothetical protein HC927_02085 [Deltaproteobacteria bacterium]|nr:hypothetical protein [Deltaproteobacteria bacterium]